MVGWYRWGDLHRDNDLPTIIHPDGIKNWYQNGKLHRDNDLPAVVISDGIKEWYQHTQLHRDNNLPAVIVPANCIYGIQAGSKMVTNTL